MLVTFFFFPFSPVAFSCFSSLASTWLQLNCKSAALAPGREEREVVEGRVSDVQPFSIEPARCYLKDHQISQIMLHEISLVALYVAYCLSITTTLTCQEPWIPQCRGYGSSSRCRMAFLNSQLALTLFQAGELCSPTDEPLCISECLYLA